MDIKALNKRISNRLGIEELEFKFEDIKEDSLLYLKENYIGINKKYENNYLESAKCLAHEYRHAFQIFYINIYQNERSNDWRKDFSKLNETLSETDYIELEIELDAYAFTKYYLEKFENLSVTHPNKSYEKLIINYILRNSEIF
ncbi:hypothetical protein [Acholeplasma granularum]|uniref:hypothetical protein n=1 Tax=Acholeplasma granularum TaxID=264635 RepID=UPI0004715F66|nr:hypothetical protein [Acholeplasma granularum]